MFLFLSTSAIHSYAPNVPVPRDLLIVGINEFKNTEVKHRYLRYCTVSRSVFQHSTVKLAKTVTHIFARRKLNTCSSIPWHFPAFFWSLDLTPRWRRPPAGICCTPAPGSSPAGSRLDGDLSNSHCTGTKIAGFSKYYKNQNIRN